MKFTWFVFPYFISFSFYIASNILKCINNSYTFLSFKEITHAYLLKVSITHNKNLNLLLKFLINCISVKSASQILSLNKEQTLLFLISQQLVYEVHPQVLYLSQI